LTVVQFPASPATAILQVRNGEYWIGDRIQLESEGVGDLSPPWVLAIKGMGDERTFPVRTWIEVVDGIWAGELWTDDGSVGPSFDVRPTIPQDAVHAVSLSGFVRVPLPLDLIAYYHGSDGTFGDYRMQALADDEGFVVTMLLSAPTGLYVRQSSRWHPVTDGNVLDGLTVHEVTARALEVFDRHEMNGWLPPVRALSAL
jgi:hypothetical protein